MSFITFLRGHRHYPLILYPIIFDFISLFIGWYLIGFHGTDKISIRLILEMGLPSLGHISNIPIFTNMTDFLNVDVTIPSYTWIVVVTMIIIGAFLQGGYISYLYAIVKGNDFHFSKFLKAGKRNWMQFIFLEIIIFLAKFGLTAFLTLFFGIVGVAASLGFLFAFRVIFVYLEFTIVIDRISVSTALKNSRIYFKKSLFMTLFLIIVMYIISATLSYFLHLLWSPLTIIAFIFIYAYIMSIIQILFMDTLYKSKNNNRTKVIAAA